jgi:hypothetical protein
MCAGPRYECAGIIYNALGFAAEKLNSFSTTVTFMLIVQEENSLFFVFA